MFIKSIKMENSFDEVLMKHARMPGQQQMNQTEIS
jgi:hypothetical protein